MDVTVSSRNVELSEALRAAAEEKVGRLDRFLDGIQRAEVHFSEERNPRIVDKEVCEITVEGRGHHVRARVAAPDTFAAVDAAVNKLEHQLHKLKTKLVSRSHPRRRGPVPVNGSSPLADALVADVPGRSDDGDDLDAAVAPGSGVPEEGPGADGTIVRVKSFALKPMNPPEAVSQMQLLGHGFFFFSNAETGRAAVVYRRAGGGVGLIDEA
ncbi:MAG: ribosome-associated translation inhibitor RaiA [Acidimicrobiia bacterium]|nr:ribosome-associated translation inhibitor RaiA [Acidimicrobiia bacterium]